MTFSGVVITIDIILLLIMLWLVTKDWNEARNSRREIFNDGYQSAVNDVVHWGFYLDEYGERHYINVEEAEPHELHYKSDEE